MSVMDSEKRKMSLAGFKDNLLRDQWQQICDDELVDEVPDIEYAPLTTLTSTEISIQDKDSYMEQELRDQQMKDEEKYKVVIKITPQDEHHPMRIATVTGILISSQITKAVGSLCATFDSLKVLRLINCNLLAESIYLLSSALSNTKIAYLYLDKNPIADQNYHIILKSNFVLQHLSLRMCRIDSLGAKNLGKALMYANPEHQKLRSLNLNGNLIDCEGMEAIAQALRWNRSLVYLSIAGNRIGNKGAKALTDSLLPFQLSYEELVFRAQRIADRLKSIRKVMYDQNQTSPKKRKNPLASDGQIDAAMNLKRTEITESISYFVQIIKNADESVPQDVHPLISEVEEYDDEFWSKGNDILFSLNISYNQVTDDGMMCFLEVAKYQEAYLTYTRGLTKLFYEGNLLEEDGAVLNGLKNYFIGKRVSNQSKTSKKKN